MKIAIVNLITRTPTKRIVPPIDSNKDAMIVKLALEIQALGHEVVLYVSDLYKPILKEELGLEIVYLKTYIRGLPELPFVPSLFSHLRNKHDIVLTSEAFQWATIFAVLARLASWKRKPRIYVWQELSVHQRALKKFPSIIFHRILLRFLLDWQIFKYIPRGLRAKKFLMNQGVAMDRFVEPIPHGVDQTVFFHEPGKVCRRYVFSPSRLVQDKGIDTLLKTFKVVRDSGIHFDLIIQGDGPDASIYESLVTELSLNGVVFFNKNRVSHDEMRRFYANASLTVIASRRDFMLFSVMESLVCGTPVVISDAIDIAEEIQEHGGGEVFACDDYEMLAARIIKIFNNPDIEFALKVSAAQVSRRYTNKYIAQKFVTLFQNDEIYSKHKCGLSVK